MKPIYAFNRGDIPGYFAVCILSLLLFANGVVCQDLCLDCKPSWTRLSDRLAVPEMKSLFQSTRFNAILNHKCMLSRLRGGSSVRTESGRNEMIKRARSFELVS